MYPQQLPGGMPSFAPPDLGSSLPGLPQGIPMPGADSGGLQGLSPELIAKVLGTNKASPEQQRINRQRQLADMLRASARDQLKGVNAGGMYIAPNLGNLAANIFAQYAAQRQDAGANQAEQQIGQQGADAASAWFRRLMGGGQ